MSSEQRPNPTRHRRAPVRLAIHSVLEPLEQRRLLSAPTSTNAEFWFGTYPHEMRFTFDQDVSATVWPEDHFLTNLTTGQQIDASHLTRSDYDSASNTAKFQIDTVIFDNGNYEDILLAPGVKNTADESLTSEKSLPFFWLSGDYNYDRVVSGDDYGPVDANLDQFPSGGATFLEGDGNYDGMVTGDDYGVLDANYGTQIPESPSAPNTLIATSAIGPGRIDIQWTLPESGPRDGFRIYRSPDGVNYTLRAQINDPNATGWFEDGLGDGVKWYHRIRAFTNADGNSHTSNEAFAVTNLPGPGTVAPSLVGPDGVTLAWEDSTDGESNWEILISTDGVNFTRWGSLLPAHNPQGQMTHRVTGLNPSTDYYFRVRALTAAQVSVESLTIQLSTLAAGTPIAPTGLSTVGTAWSDGVTISWQDNASDEDFYLIEWSGGSGWNVIDELPANASTYTDDYPVLSDSFYRVRAGRNSGGILSGPSHEQSVHPIAPPVAWHDDNAGANSRGTLSPFATVHDTPLTFSVLPNDEDYDNGAVRVVSFDQPANGSVVLDADGTFTYTPREGFVGTDSFAYTINDGSADSAPATAAIDVTNRAPTAGHQDIQTGSTLGSGYRQPLQATLSGSDADDDLLTYHLDKQPRFGTVTIDEATGAFEYRPNNYTSFPGYDYFTFKVNDGLIESLPARVRIQTNFSRVSGVYHFGDQWMYEWSVDNGPDRGSISVTPPAGSTSPTEAGYTYPTSSSVTYTAQNPDVTYDFMSIVARVGDFESKPIRVFYQNYGSWPEGEWPHLGGSGNQFQVSAFEQTTYSALQTGFKPEGFQGQMRLGASPAHGTVTLAADGGFTYQPQAPAAGEEPFMGLDYFSVLYTQPDGLETVHWVELSVGESLPIPPAMVSEPESDWSSTPFNGTLEELNSKLSVVEGKRNAVLRQFEALGQAWQTIHANSDGSADDVLSAADGATAALDALESAYLTYQDAWLELMGNAASYQNTWQAYIDNVWDSETYAKVLAGIQALPRDIGGLQPNPEYTQQITDALSALGDAAGFQSNAAGTVFTTATYTHKVLETVEYTLGLFTGGTYTAATLTTKAGLAALAKTVARNYVIGEIAEQAVTPVMSTALSLAAQANINLDPNAVRAGLLALQATGAIKAAKGRLRPYTPPSPHKALQKAIKFKGAAQKDLRASMEELHGSAAMVGKDAHHAIPLELAGEAGDVGRIVAKAKQGGFNYSDGGHNGIIAPAGHGPHPEYTQWIRDYILANKDRATTPHGAKTVLDEAVAEARNNIDFWFGD